MYTAEIIAVGTELLLGSIANTNAQYLSRELNALGIGVCYHTVVGDNPERLLRSEIPMEPHDAIIHWVVTEKALYEDGIPEQMS